MSGEQEFCFFDFDELKGDERNRIEVILRSGNSVVLPWNDSNNIPVDGGMLIDQSGHLSHASIHGHALPVPLPPIYGCAAPSVMAPPSMMSGIMTNVYPYAPGVMFNTGMYMPMVPVAATLSPNGMVTSEMAYHPVTMSSSDGSVYMSQPPPQLLMGPIETHLPVATPTCPVTVAPVGSHAFVNPHILHTPVPASSLVIPQPHNHLGPVASQPFPPLTGYVVEDGTKPEESECNPADCYKKQMVQPGSGDNDQKDLSDGNDVSLKDGTLGRSHETRTNFSPSEGVALEKGDAAIGAAGLVSRWPADTAARPQLPSLNSYDGPAVSCDAIAGDQSAFPPLLARASNSRRPSAASDGEASGSVNGIISANDNMQPAAAGAENSPALPACQPKMKSWASLLHNTASAASAIVVNASDQSQNIHSRKATDAQAAIMNRDMPASYELTKSMAPIAEVREELMELLKNHKLNHRSIYLQPRGLANRANWCYVNATLQALLACPPFYHLIKTISKINPGFWEVSSFHAMKCLIHFFDEFSVVSGKLHDKQGVTAWGNAKSDIKSGTTFEPACVYKMLQAIDYKAFKYNQQEDAEEFLSCILNRLHDEMVNAMKQLEGSDGKKDVVTTNCVTNGKEQDKRVVDDGDDDTRWEQVRARNRTVYSSTAGSETSPISAIFRGQICCILHQLGQKESATLQPFFTLQLDVQNDKVKSVQDALEQLVSKESLLGYTCTKSNVEVDATQRTLIEELPPVLVLHLKWFHYDKNGGLQKRIKQVDFDIDMELGKDLLSSHSKARTQVNQRKYKLFAVVNHIGARAIGGHYIVDVFHPGYNCWIRCDDNNISSIPTAHVTKFTAPKVPYLMFYRRFEPS